MITPEMMKTASRVIGITSRHAMALITMFPEYAEKIEALDDISDPYGGSLEIYKNCLADIEAAGEKNVRRSRR